MICGDVRLQTLVGLQAPQKPLQRQYYWQYTFLRSKNSRCKSTCNCKRHVPSPAHKIIIISTNQNHHHLHRLLRLSYYPCHRSATHQNRHRLVSTSGRLVLHVTSCPSSSRLRTRDTFSHYRYQRSSTPTTQPTCHQICTLFSFHITLYRYDARRLPTHHIAASSTGTSYVAYRRYIVTS